MPKNVESCAVASMSEVWECYRLELGAVEDQIRQNLGSKVALVNTVAAHILNSGGKRIRPLLLILCARLAGYAGRDEDRKSTRLNCSHGYPSYAVFCFKKKQRTFRSSMLRESSH